MQAVKGSVGFKGDTECTYMLLAVACQKKKSILDWCIRDVNRWSCGRLVG